MSLFRKQGLIACVLLATLAGGFSALFLDEIIKSRLETDGSETLKRQLNADWLKTSLLTQTAETGNLTVANPDDPMSNQITVESIRLRANGSLALLKKAVVEEMAITGVRFNQPRKTAAKSFGPSSPPETRDAKSGKPGKRLSAGGLEFKSPEEILKSEKLETVEKARAAREEIESLKNKWEEKLKIYRDPGAMDSLHSRIKNLKVKIKDRSGLSLLTEAPAAMEEAKTIKKEINFRLEEIKIFQEEIKRDAARIKTLTAELKELPEKDYRRLKDKYSPDAQGGVNLLSAVLEGEFKNKLDTFWKYYRQVQPYLDRLAREKEQKNVYVRGKGQTIFFPQATPYPDLLIRNADLSLYAGEILLSGNLLDFSDNQPLYGKPAILTLRSEATDRFQSLDLKIIVDRTTATARDETRMEIVETPLAGISLQEGVSLSGGKANVAANLAITGQKDLNGTIEIKGTAPALAPSEILESGMGKILADAMEGLDGFYVKTVISGTLDDYRITIETDLDKILGAAAKKFFAEKLKSFDHELNKAIRSASEPLLGEAADSETSFMNLEKIPANQEKSFGGLLGKLPKIPGISSDPASPLNNLKLPF